MSADDLWFPVFVVCLMFAWMIFQQTIISEQLREGNMALVDDLQLVKTQLEKAKDEIVARIGGLEDALASAGEQSADVTAAVADLKAVAQGLDDVVADVPAAVEVEEEVPAEVPAEEVPAEVPVEEAPAE